MTEANFDDAPNIEERNTGTKQTHALHNINMHITDTTAVSQLLMDTMSPS